MKSLSLKLSEGLDQQLATIAHTQQTTKSEILREALAVYLTKNDSHRSGSCLALANDLVGCVEGPEDLSVDKRHLNGFGE